MELKPNWNEKVEAIIKEVAKFSYRVPAVVIIHSLPELRIIYMSERGLQLLGKRWDDIATLATGEFERLYFNEEDAKDYTPKIVNLMNSETDDPVSYFQQVRTGKNNGFDWYMSMTKVLLRHDDGRPGLLITIALQVDPQNHFTAKASRLLDENTFLKKHYHLFAKLTNREKEILRLSALGKSASEIASQLNISEATVETHRRNMRKKLNVNSQYDLYRYASAFALI